MNADRRSEHQAIHHESARLAAALLERLTNGVGSGSMGRSGLNSYVSVADLGAKHQCVRIAQPGFAGRPIRNSLPEWRMLIF